MIVVVVSIVCQQARFANSDWPSETLMNVSTVDDDAV